MKGLIYKPIVYGLMIELGIPIITITILSVIGLSNELGLYSLLFILVLCRVSAIAAANNFCYLYDIEKGKYLWILLSIIFGGWSLVAFNVFIWIKESNKKEED